LFSCFRVFKTSAFDAPPRDPVISAQDVQLPALWIAGQSRGRFEKMDKRARQPALRSIGAIDQSAELAEVHQHIGNYLLTPTPQQPRRHETLEGADKFARMA
jgi:hypothetical protein